MLIADAATSVVAVVLIGGVVIFITLLTWWGLRGRARLARVMKSPLYAEGDTTEHPPGSAVEIEDAGQIPVRVLLGGCAFATAMT